MSLKLHIGCGKRVIPGWDHIDEADFPHITSKDVTKLPYKDCTVDAIYSSHLLEYFTRDEAINVLREWKRVLKSGGTLYLAVPDFDALASRYIEGNASLFEILGPLFGEMKCNDSTIHHKTTWNYVELGNLLRCLGFKGIKKIQDYGMLSILNEEEGVPDVFDDHSLSYLAGKHISLNMVCTKE